MKRTKIYNNLLKNLYILLGPDASELMDLVTADRFEVGSAAWTSATGVMYSGDMQLGPNLMDNQLRYNELDDEEIEWLVACAEYLETPLVYPTYDSREDYFINWIGTQSEEEGVIVWRHGIVFLLAYWDMKEKEVIEPVKPKEIRTRTTLVVPMFKE